MKAFKEIGLFKSIKFVFFTFVEAFLAIAFIPQIRVLVLKLFGASIGKNSIVLNATFMNLYRGSFKNLKIGDNCYIGRGVLLDLTGKIKIGNNVTISERSILITHVNVGYKNHPLQALYPAKVKNISVGNGSFIGVGSIVLPGIIISKKSLVGAGSVVTKNVPPNTVAAGVPAIKIKSLKNE